MAAVEQLRSRRKLRFGESAVAIVTGHGIKAQGTTRRLLKGYPGLLRTAQQIIGRKRRESPVLGGKARAGQRRVVAANLSAVQQAFHDLAEAAPALAPYSMNSFFTT